MQKDPVCGMKVDEKSTELWRSEEKWSLSSVAIATFIIFPTSEHGQIKVSSQGKLLLARTDDYTHHGGDEIGGLGTN